MHSGIYARKAGYTLSFAAIFSVKRFIYNFMSDMSQHCTKTAKLSITQTTPYDSTRTLVFDGVILYGAAKRWGRLKWRFSIAISQKRWKIGTLPRNADRKLYVLYRMTLYPVTLSDPNYPIHHISTFVLRFISSYWMEIKTSNLVGKLIIASPSPRTTKPSLKGAWSSHVNHLNFGGNHISGMAEARVFKFCIQVGYVKSLISMTNHP